jgi:transposase
VPARPAPRHQPAQGAAGHCTSLGPRGARRPVRVGVGHYLRQVPTDQADLADPLHASKAALQAVAKRIELLEAELTLADQRLAKLVGRVAPRLLAIGNDHAGQLLVTAGQHPERLRGEAAFAHLCGVAPIPASSGKTHRHRLHRGGDRDANKALHLAVVVRMRFCPRTRAHVQRRTKKGLSKPEIMRCIKRYLAREVYHALVADFEALHAT